MDDGPRTNDDIRAEAPTFERRRLDLLERLRAGATTGRRRWAAQRLLVEETIPEAQAMATRRWLRQEPSGRTRGRDA